MKSWKSVSVIALGIAAVVGLSACGAATPPETEPTPSATVPTETPEAVPADTETGTDGEITVGSTVFPDLVTIRCADLSVQDLAPWGQKTLPTTETVNLTSFSSCSADMDMNGDADARTDSGHVVGGLLEAVDGSQVDVSLLNDYDNWALCVSGTRTDVAVAAGWDYASGCVDENGSLLDVTYLVVGTTIVGDLATLTCNVHAGPFGLNGREADLERFCGGVLEAANRGTYGD